MQSVVRCNGDSGYCGGVLYVLIVEVSIRAFCLVPLFLSFFYFYGVGGDEVIDS